MNWKTEEEEDEENTHTHTTHTRRHQFFFRIYASTHRDKCIYTVLVEEEETQEEIMHDDDDDELVLLLSCFSLCTHRRRRRRQKIQKKTRSPVANRIQERKNTNQNTLFSAAKPPNKKSYQSSTRTNTQKY